MPCSCVDYDTILHKLIFVFSISGYPPKTGTAILRIFVEDENDNAPEFVQPLNAQVMELEDPPKYVVTFSARDRDTPKYGAPFHFSLPPCEENPSCHDGFLDFTMEFDPSKCIELIPIC